MLVQALSTYFYREGTGAERVPGEPLPGPLQGRPRREVTCPILTQVVSLSPPLSCSRILVCFHIPELTFLSTSSVLIASSVALEYPIAFFAFFRFFRMSFFIFSLSFCVFFISLCCPFVLAPHS